MAVARPTLELDMPSPPPNWKNLLWLPGARGVGRKTKHSAVNALVWKLRKI